MSEHSTRKPRSRKAAERPKKPYSDYPLYPHPLGYWAKKVRGTMRYYGRWAKIVKGKLTPVPYEQGWQEALTLYKAQIDDHKLSRESRAKLVDGKLVQGETGVTVMDLCNRFLTEKQNRLDAGKLSARMFAEYKLTTDRLFATFGKNRLVTDFTAGDFSALLKALEDQYGPVRTGNEVQKVRTVFKFAYDEGLIEQPIRYGSQFKKPSATILRKHRAASGEKTFEASELRRLIDAAGVPMKAMLLLGINAAYGNHDIATLPRSALDLDGGWISYPRPKTGINRRVKLWPETVQAIGDTLAQRPEPRQESAEGLVFLTCRGRPWLVRGIANPVSVAARKLIKTVGIQHNHLAFYALRHTFRTVADAAKDPSAIRLIMGHTDSSIDATYTHSIEDARLEAVARHVHDWLWPTPAKQPANDKPAKPKPAPKKKQQEPSPVPALKLFAG